MPRSKQRKRHHEQQRSSTLVKTNKKRSAVNVAMIFFALLGMGIAYFATGSSIVWILVGAAAGAAGGYFFGKQIDRTLDKK